jgi:hypothetical protein
MQDNYNYWNKNMEHCKPKLKEPAKLFKPKELKWYRLLKNNWVLCLKQSKGFKPDSWKISLLIKAVLLYKLWNNAREWKKRLLFLNKKMIFLVKSKS